MRDWMQARLTRDVDDHEVRRRVRMKELDTLERSFICLVSCYCFSLLLLSKTKTCMNFV